jgi:hypothetical protein
MWIVIGAIFWAVFPQRAEEWVHSRMGAQNL